MSFNLHLRPLFLDPAASFTSQFPVHQLRQLLDFFSSLSPMDVSRDKDDDPDKNYWQHYPSSNLQLLNSRHEYICIWKILNLWTPGEKSVNKKLYFCNSFKIWVGRALEDTKLYGDDSHKLTKKTFGKKNEHYRKSKTVWSLKFTKWPLNVE